jgi:hypothetical protein
MSLRIFKDSPIVMQQNLGNTVLIDNKHSSFKKVSHEQ